MVYFTKITLKKRVSTLGYDLYMQKYVVWKELCKGHAQDLEEETL